MAAPCGACSGISDRRRGSGYTAAVGVPHLGLCRPLTILPTCYTEYRRVIAFCRGCWPVNWLDWLLLGALILSAFAGMRVGLFWSMAAFGSLLVGWYFAGNVSNAASQAVEVWTDSTTVQATVTVLIYVALMAIMLYAAQPRHSGHQAPPLHDNPGNLECHRPGGGARAGVHRRSYGFGGCRACRGAAHVPDRP